jgi:hypothetical protein
MIETLSGFIYSLMGALVLLAIQESIKFLKERNGSLTGIWIQEIPKKYDQEAKTDLVTCRNVGKKLKGKIERISPPEQSHKKWRFEGQIVDSIIFLTFWTTDKKRNAGSYGTIHMLKKDDNKCLGSYVKTIVKDENKSLTFEPKEFELNWQVKNS